MLSLSFLSLAACQKQTASAWIGDDTAGATAIIDLSGGWSVDFAEDCFTLYDCEITENADYAAMGVIVEKAAYNDYLKAAQNSDTYKKTNDYVYFENEDGAIYLRIINNEAHFVLIVPNKGIAKQIYKRTAFAKVD